MASSKNLMQKIVDDLSGQIELSYKSMFGEYGIYYDGKFVAILSDNQFFVKPTEAGRNFIGDPMEAPPYPGAKNYFFIDEPFMKDTKWLGELISHTADELPLPKPKKKK